MLDYEYDLLLERLEEKRVPARPSLPLPTPSLPVARKVKAGWALSSSPTRADASEIYIHVRMLDRRTSGNKSPGVIGVNLIYGTSIRTKTETLIRSLLDSLTWERVEVDMIRFADRRLRELTTGSWRFNWCARLTEAAMFTAQGEAIQWAECYIKAGSGQRGSFRPVTKATLDVLERGRTIPSGTGTQREQPHVNGNDTAPPDVGPRHRYADFLQRTETLRAGKTVLISNFAGSIAWPRTLGDIQPSAGIALGASIWKFSTSFYNESEGGLLGGWTAFQIPRLYIYPHRTSRPGRSSPPKVILSPHI
jgi:hypothetical protein